MDASIEHIMQDLFRAPVATRNAALLAARRAMNNKPTALLITQAEVGRLLSVSRFTLWRMKKEKSLVPVQVRGMDRYRLSDIEAIAGGVQ